MATGSRIRQTGWAVLLAFCGAAFLVLTFHVNSVKNKVYLAERTIIELERKKQALEIEFQARANQQQLADWNKIEFGYNAPRADQYLDNERQLAALGLARDANAPAPIRVAFNSEEGDPVFPAMVSPMTGQPADQSDDADDEPSNAPTALSAGRSLAERLSRGAGVTGSLGATHIAQAGE